MGRVCTVTLKANRSKIRVLICLLCLMFATDVHATDGTHEHSFGNPDEHSTNGYLGMFVSKFDFTPEHPRSNEKTNFSLVVVNSYQIKEKIEEVPIEEHANLVITATKGDRTLKKSGRFSGNGRFDGSLTFPVPGTWQINVQGTRINPDGSTSEMEFNATINVDQGQFESVNQATIWSWVLFGLTCGFIIMAFFGKAMSMRKKSSRL